MNQIEQIQRLGEILRTRRTELQELEAQVTAKKTEIREIEEVNLPTLMDELGFEAIDLQGGGRIEVKDFIQANISEANKAEAFNWLRETQNDGIIKNEIKVNIDRGQNELAESVLQTLTELGVRPSQKQSIHHATLKAFITEVLNNPDLRDSLPRDAFSVYEGRKVVFK
jgi:hypothetical protein